MTVGCYDVLAVLASASLSASLPSTSGDAPLSMMCIHALHLKLLSEKGYHVSRSDNARCQENVTEFCKFLNAFFGHSRELAPP